MAGQVHFYVNRVHGIGGVTTWSFQAASFLSSRYAARVLTWSDSELEPPDAHLFPEQAVRIWAVPKGAAVGVAPPVDPKTPREVKPRKETLPTWPTKEAKPVKPIRKGLQPADPLDASVEEALRQAALFIPNYLDFGYQLAALSRIRGTVSRCIGICHCDQDNYYAQLRRYEPIINSFITVSRRCTQRLRDYLPARAADIHFVPYGVALAPWRPPPATRGPLRLLYAGRLTNGQKRIFDLVELVKMLASRALDYTLDIVGVGPDREPLLLALAGQPRVRIWSGVAYPDMGKVYASCEVFLLPSETEGTSIALLESMAHGLVPIATRVSGSEDVIADGVNGYLCNVGDVHAMADRIVTLADRESLRAELSRRAYETIARHYRSETQLAAFAECVRETLSKPLIAPERALQVLQEEPPLQLR